MFKSFALKLKESVFSVLPIALVVVALTLFITPVSLNVYVKFLIGTVFLIAGMGLFTLGADMSMSPMGEQIGAGLSKTKKLSVMIVGSLVVGFIITLAEPDLTVLASQVPGLDKWILLIAVSLGVGVFLVLACIKTVFQLKLSTILIVVYGVILLMAFFVPNNYMSLAFDSSGVTTGPISVPFLISFGLGLSSIKASRNAMDDSFGIIGLCSAGPIISVMIISIFLPSSENLTSTITTMTIGESFVKYLGDVALILLPILIIFFVFQFTILKLPKIKIYKIVLGIVYTYVGVVLFLVGVNSGYLDIAYEIGQQIAQLSYSWIVYPLSFVLGFFIIAAEPAVHVLKKKVEDITGGMIKQKTILITVSIGVAISVFLATVKIVYDINILWFLIPVYLVILGLSLYNTPLFTAVAFDSGGTATGAMAVSFILPFLTGFGGENVSSLGTIALIACMPILAIQILGAVYVMGNNRAKAKSKEIYSSKVEIIDFVYGGKR